eukprot:COSAG02_NODE_548_length_20472_cov_5.958524_6_plen_181_part_00
MGVNASVCIQDDSAGEPQGCHLRTCCGTDAGGDDALRRLNTFAGSVYKPGDRVEYSSEENQQWLPAQVTTINSDETLTLSVGAKTYSHVSPHKVRRKRHKQAVLPPVPVYSHDRSSLRRLKTSGGSRYEAGNLIEYSSNSQHDWIPATVEHVNHDRTLKIKCHNGNGFEQVSPHKVRHMR